MRCWRRSSRLDSGYRYPGKKIHQLTLRADQVLPVRRRIAHYRKLQLALERICEYNRQQLREPSEAKS